MTSLFSEHAIDQANHFRVIGFLFVYKLYFNCEIDHKKM